MSRRLVVEPHLTEAELRREMEAAREPTVRLRWTAVLHFSLGKSAKVIGEFCNRKPDWVRRTVRAYNAEGPKGLLDGRKSNGTVGRFTPELQAELRKALDNDPPPGGGLWNGPKVARWVAERTGDTVHPRTGWAYLRQMGWVLKVPLPKHPEGQEAKKEAFKKGGSKQKSSGSYRAILTRA